MSKQPSRLDKMQSLLDRLHYWQPIIGEALRHGKCAHTFDDVLDMIIHDRVLFFESGDAFTIMEFINYPNFRVFHCFLAGGEIKAVQAMEPMLAKVGKDTGCKYLSIAGRKGWERVLTGSGWEPVCTTMYKEIEQ